MKNEGVKILLGVPACILSQKHFIPSFFMLIVGEMAA